VAILAAKGVEQVELVRPRDAVMAAGAEVTLVSLESGEIQAMNGDIHLADTFAVDKTVAQTSPEEYDALILPGGTVNPDTLRQDADAVSFVRDFVNSGKPVGVICHGPWTLVEAGVVQGRTPDVLPEHSYRPGQRRRQRGGRGSGDRQRPGVQSQPRRPGRLLREDRRGVRQGQARGGRSTVRATQRR